MLQRILVFVGYFIPTKGGYIESTLGLCQQLRSRGIGIDVLTDNTDSLPEYEVFEGITIYRIPCWHILNGTFPIFKPFFHTFRLLFHLRKKGYALVMTHTRFFPTSFLGFLFSMLFRIPYIHVERGSCHSVVNSKLVDFLSRIYDHTFGFLVARFARYNVGVSESACNFLRHLGAKNIVRIPNGIDAPILSNEESSHVYEKWGLTKNTTIIIFVGRLIYAKGAQDLIRAISHIKEPFMLLFVGDGNYRKALETFTRELQLLHHVRFLGEKTQKEVREILSMSTFFVNPSYSEGLPRSVLEACALGVPVIATDVGGTSEIILNKKTGLLIQPGNPKGLLDALNLFIENPDLRREFGENAREHVKKHFSWSNVTDEYIRLFQNLT